MGRYNAVSAARSQVRFWSLTCLSKPLTGQDHTP